MKLLTGTGPGKYPCPRSLPSELEHTSKTKVTDQGGLRPLERGLHTLPLPHNPHKPWERSVRPVARSRENRALVMQDGETGTDQKGLLIDTLLQLTHHTP